MPPKKRISYLKQLLKKREDTRMRRRKAMQGSSDPDTEVQDPPPPVAPVAPPPSLIPKTEFVFFEKRSVDVNYFLSGLRRVNKHHKTLSCGISDLIICKEAIRGDKRGIVFRCKVCMTPCTVWFEDPYSVWIKEPYMEGVDTVKGQATEVCMGTRRATKVCMETSNQGGVDVDTVKRQVTEVCMETSDQGVVGVNTVNGQATKTAAETPIATYSMDGKKDSLLPKRTIVLTLPISRKPEVDLKGQSNISLVGQSQAPVIPQSNSPLIRHAQVSPIQKGRLSGAGVRTTGKDTISSFTNTALANLKFFVVNPVNTSAAQMTVPRRPTVETRPKKATVTPDVIPRSHTSSPSAPRRIIASAQILQPQSTQSRVGTAAPKRIRLSSNDLPKFFSTQSYLPNVGTTAKTLKSQKIFLVHGTKKTSQLPRVQLDSKTTAKEASRSVFVPLSQSISIQSIGSGTSSTMTLPETITPDIATPDVLPVDLNLVKKEKIETVSVQLTSSGIATTVPEVITSDISTADNISVDLNLVKKEKNETESVQLTSSGIATTVPEVITSDISTADNFSVNLNLVKKEIEGS